MKKGQSRANAVRESKRKEIIEYLKKRPLVQQIVENSEKLSNLEIELTTTDIQRLKAANDGFSSLIKKYLPDVKQTELVGEEGEAIRIKNDWTVEFVNADKGDRK